MQPDALDRIRHHRRTLAARWTRECIASHGGRIWRDTERLDRATTQGMDMIVDAAASGQVEPFVEFAGRFSQEALALQVPLDEVVRALLHPKPLVFALLDEPAPSLLDPDAVEFLNRLLSAGIVEAIRRHERQQDRRTIAAQEQIDELRERLRRQVVVDRETGLFNANYFAEAVRREVLRSRRFGRIFAIGLVTVDQDDEVRDTLGESGARDVAQQFADLLARLTRQVDVRAALGSGRFGMVLPETTLEGAFAFAERVRLSVEAHTFTLVDHPYPLTHTISTGLAVYPRDGDDDQVLLARAEEALARARIGRNTTVAAATAQDL